MLKIFFYIKIIFLFSFTYEVLAASSINQAEFSFLYGAGSSSSINRIIGKGKLIPPVSQFMGVEYRSPTLFYRFPIKLDMQILKHFDRQHAFEGVICPVIETPKVFLGKVGFNWAVGNGVSGLIGKYTDFEEISSGVKTRRFLNYLLVEQNMFLKEDPTYQLTLRWHHRCHVFGTIAPKGTGSNFFVIGIKYLM